MRDHLRTRVLLASLPATSSRREEPTLLLPPVADQLQGEVGSISYLNAVISSLKFGLRFYTVLTSAQCSIIEHSDKHANWFDKYGVPWSAQWHIAVLLSNKRKEWDQITEKDIKALSGTNTIVGPKIPGVLFPNDRRRALDNRTPSRLGDLYVELDKEEAALNKGSLETLGLSSQSEDTTHLSIGTWWGGRIEQRAVIVRSNAHVTPHPSMCRGAPPPKTCWSIQLRHQAIRGKSCRFTRQFGSRRFIQLGLPEDLTQDERSSLKEELLKPYLLHGRVFRAFSAQDGTVRLVETDENVGRIARPEAGDSRRLSFRQFLDWFNPLERNAAQASYICNGSLACC